MKTKFSLAVALVCLFAVAAWAATDASVGTWKLNDAKSKLPAGMPQNRTVTYTEEGDNLKCVIEGVDGKGNPTHTEWIGKFDGKPYPITGSAVADARTITKVDAHHFKVVESKDGEPIMMGVIEIARDDKTRTVTVHGKGADGKPLTIVMAYDRQ